MKKCNLAIYKTQPAVQLIFDQMGLDYTQLASNSNFSDYDIIVADDQVSPMEIPIFLQFVKQGGSLLCDSKAFAILLTQPIRKKFVRSKIADEKSIFRQLNMIDFFSDFYLTNYHGKFLDKSLHLFEHKIGEGFIACFPFSLPELFIKVSCQRKKGYDERKELPSERVSKASKGKISKIILLLLHYLSEKKNRQFMTKKNVPDPGVFIFRIDTDFCSLVQAEKMYEICQKHQIRATWFVDTVMEENLYFYQTMQQQEIGLHCQRHLVFKKYQKNFENIQNGLHKLTKFEFFSKGFAAPFGEWNESLQLALDNSGFLYSSEFCYDYDNLPSYPFYESKFSPVLQIPIHPISPGRLRRSHYSDKEKANYFKAIIDEAFIEKRPIILYHHPHHECWDLWEEIFSYINEKQITKMTMLDYYHWWKKREKSNEFYQSFFPKIPIRQRKYLKKMRQFHWRDWFYNYEHWRGKQRL